MNLAAIVTRAAEQVGERAAIKLGDRVTTYRGLDEASARAAALLRARGAVPGDRVVLALPNSPWFPAFYYGALRMGAIAVPLNVLMREQELVACLTHCEARLLVAWHEALEHARAARASVDFDLIEVNPATADELLAAHPPERALADVAPDATAVLQYSSGTTGESHAAELTHANLDASSRLMLEALGSVDGEVVLSAAPFAHSYGQNVGMSTILRGHGTLALMTRFDAAEALEVVDRERVSIAVGVPTMCARMLELDPLPSRMPSLRLFLAAGGRMPVRLLHEFERAFGCEVLEGYGMSEAPRIAVNRPGRRKPGSVGLPLRELEVRLLDANGEPAPPGEAGELSVRGPNVMKRYWRRPAATAEMMRDGWLHTGDLALIDEDGYIHIVGRLKDTIVRGGYTIYAAEVERVMATHPRVAEVAVVRVPDAEMGEEVGAAVVLVRGGDPPDPEELKGFVRERLAPYKYPRVLWFAESLPRTATGKVIKRAIAIPPELVRSGEGAGGTS